MHRCGSLMEVAELFQGYLKVYRNGDHSRTRVEKTNKFKIAQSI